MKSFVTISCFGEVLTKMPEAQSRATTARVLNRFLQVCDASRGTQLPELGFQELRVQLDIVEAGASGSFEGKSIAHN